MNNRQRLFVERYLEDPHATRAAIAAGYSERTAYSQGSRLLRHPDVAEELERRQERLRASTDIKVGDIVQQLDAIRLDPGVAMRERLRAVELLGKHLGMFNDRTEVNQQVAVVVRHTPPLA